MALVLVDTSVWVQVHRRLLDIDSQVASDDIAICPAIAQELLQGAQDPEQYVRVWDIILGAQMLDDPTPLEVFEDARTSIGNAETGGMSSPHHTTV